MNSQQFLADSGVEIGDTRDSGIIGGRAFVIPPTLTYPAARVATGLPARIQFCAGEDLSAFIQREGVSRITNKRPSLAQFNFSHVAPNENWLHPSWMASMAT